MDKWLPIAGFEGIYSVSDVGRVRYEQSRGQGRKVVAGDMVAAARDLDGYAIVPLGRVEERDKRRSHRVSRLVAVAFLGPPPFPKAQVNHKNGCRSDDTAENLEWITAAGNIRHSIEYLRRDYRGVKSRCSKLTEVQVIELRERAARGELFMSLAVAFKLTNVAVSSIARGKNYTNVGGPRSVPRTGTERKRMAAELGVPVHRKHRK